MKMLICLRLHCSEFWSIWFSIRQSSCISNGAWRWSTAELFKRKDHEWNHDTCNSLLSLMICLSTANI